MAPEVAGVAVLPIGREVFIAAAKTGDFVVTALEIVQSEPESYPPRRLFCCSAPGCDAVT